MAQYRRGRTSGRRLADRRQLTLRLPSALEAPVRTAADHADIASATLLVLIVGAQHNWPLPNWALDRRWRPGAHNSTCTGHPEPGTPESLSAALDATFDAAPADAVAHDGKRGWQITVYVPREWLPELEERAQLHGAPLAKYLADVVTTHVRSCATHGPGQHDPRSSTRFTAAEHAECGAARARTHGLQEVLPLAG